MILDSLENVGLYESIHPRFKHAFEFLKSTDLNSLPLGKIELEGSDLFLSVVEITGKTADKAKMETHNSYIDIHVPLNCVETMGWKAGNTLNGLTAPYDSDNDISFFTDKATNFIVVQPSEFVIFFPQDGHQPGIADQTYKKIIVKILL